MAMKNRDSKQRQREQHEFRRDIEHREILPTG
jgi:hypothetical protein